MQVAAIFDIHGNLPALEAVLEEVRQADVDQIVVGGDVLPGPMPRETLARLRELGEKVEFIYGNCEMAALEVLSGKQPAGLAEQVVSTIRWSAQQLDPVWEQELRAWPATLRLQLSGLGEVLFCHATPRNENEIFSRGTAEELLLPIFDSAHADVVVCGHTHMQFDRMIGKVRVVNAGSVGMPFGKAGADWLLLGPDVQFRHTSYDLKQAAERVRRTEYPEAREFAEQYILQPPSEEKMLELFARAELK
jgi:putative phosphoesterase